MSERISQESEYKYQAYTWADEEELKVLLAQTKEEVSIIRVPTNTDTEKRLAAAAFAKNVILDSFDSQKVSPLSEGLLERIIKKTESDTLRALNNGHSDGRNIYLVRTDSKEFAADGFKKMAKILGQVAEQRRRSIAIKHGFHPTIEKVEFSVNSDENPDIQPIEND